MALVPDEESRCAWRWKAAPADGPPPVLTCWSRLARDGALSLSAELESAQADWPAPESVCGAAPTETQSTQLAAQYYPKTETNQKLNFPRYTKGEIVPTKKKPQRFVVSLFMEEFFNWFSTAFSQGQIAGREGTKNDDIPVVWIDTPHLLDDKKGVQAFCPLIFGRDVN